MNTIRKELRLTDDKVMNALNLFSLVEATLELSKEVREFIEQAKDDEIVHAFYDVTTKQHVIQLVQTTHNTHTNSPYYEHQNIRLEFSQ